MQITMDVTDTELNMIQDLLFGGRLKIRTTDNNAALIINTFRSIVNKKGYMTVTDYKRVVEHNVSEIMVVSGYSYLARSFIINDEYGWTKEDFDHLRIIMTDESCILVMPECHRLDSGNDL